MAGYGLDDSDFEDLLESSDDEAVVLAPSLEGPVLPKLHVVIAATAWRGPVEGDTGDASRLVPPNRYENAHP